MVLTRNLFHSVLWLALTLVGTAGLFLLLDAEFLAAVQLLLYAGGVVTIVVFAIMLTERLVGRVHPPDQPRHPRRGGVAAAVFVGLLRDPPAGPPGPRSAGARAHDARPSARRAHELGVCPSSCWASSSRRARRRALLRAAGRVRACPAETRTRAAREAGRADRYLPSRPASSPSASSASSPGERRRHPPRHRADAERGQHQPGGLRPLQRGRGGLVLTVFTIASRWRRWRWAWPSSS